MAASIEATAGDVPGHVTPSAVRVSVLGSLTVEVGGQPQHVAGTQRRRLMAVLASRAGRLVPVDAIIDALWLDDPPPSAAKTLQSHVVRLRKSLADAGGDVIETVPGGYRLALEPDAVDAVRFERLVAAAERAASDGDPAAAAVALTGALDLVRGPAYVEFRDADFARAEGARLDELRLVAMEDLAELQLQMGAPGSAVPALERLVRSEPGRERAWGLLMRALYGAGRQHAALDAYQRARRALADGFGLEPGPALRSIERDIVAGDIAEAAAGRSVLAAALRSSTPMVGRAAERAALDLAWRAASEGRGQVRIVQGPLDSGRTRLAADLAGRVVATGGDVEYARATDLIATIVPPNDDRAFSVGAVVDVVAERARGQRLVLIVDDVEWSSEHATEVLVALAGAAEQITLLLLLVLDPTGGGPAVRELQRLDPSGALTLELGPMSDDDIAAIVAADGVDDDGVAAVVGVSSGLPGVARREAAAWSERTASDRLRNAAVTSMGATSLADQAQASVLDEVLDLVAARSRRDELWSARWAGRQPYRALAAYEPQDADLFVGRERLLAELTARVLERRMVAVVGPSGSGKSSLVRAGLVPLARSGRLPGGAPWAADVIVPGRDPVASLDAMADLDEPGPRLLVVDQFEESFVALGPDVERFTDRLVALACDAALDVHVVIVVRSDEFTELGTVAVLADLVERSQLIVRPPNHDELRRIVVEPARRTGVAVEPELVDLVVHDVGDDEAALPLLSAALAEVWERRDGAVLRAARYVEIGGLASSVERLGEQAVRRARSERDVRDVMIALADVTEEGVWTRRRLTPGEIPDRLSDAVQELVAARLVVRSDTTVEVVHEVVFRAWPRLAAWLEEARGDVVLEREIRAAARAWDAFGRHGDAVYRGARLHAALEWQARRDETPPALIVDFLVAGRNHEEKETREMRERLAREQRSRRRLARSLAAAAILLVTAVVAAAVALVSQGRAEEARRDAEESAALAEERQGQAEIAEAAAERERDTARDARLLAESERLASSQPDLAMLLAAEAYGRADTPATRAALMTALGAFAPPAEAASSDVRVNTTFLGYLNGPRDLPISAPISGDGTLAIAAWNPSVEQGVITGFDMIGRREVFRAELPTAISNVIVDETGSHVVASGHAEVFIVDPTDGSAREVETHLEPGVHVAGLSFRPGRDQFLVVGDEAMSLYDANTGDRLEVTLPTTSANLGGFRPDGLLTVGDLEWGGTNWDLDSGMMVGRVQLDAAGAGTHFRFSSDSSRLAAFVDYSVTEESSLHVWDSTTGAEIGEATARPLGITTFAFDPTNPDVIAVTPRTGGIVFVDVETGVTVGSAAEGLLGEVADLMYTKDGSLLVVTAVDGSVTLWGREGGAGLVERTVADGALDVEIADDGDVALVATSAGALEVRDPRVLDSAGAAIEMPAHSSIEAMALSDDGTTALVVTSPPTLHAVDLVGRDVRWSKPLAMIDDRIAISADGATGITLDDEAITLWDIRAGTILGSRSSDPPLPDVVFGAPQFVADPDVVEIPDGARQHRLRLSDLRFVGRSFTVPTVDGQPVDVPGSDDAVAPHVGGGLVRFERATGTTVVANRAADVTPSAPVWIDADGSIVAVFDDDTATLSLFEASTLEPIGWPFPVASTTNDVEFTSDAVLVPGRAGAVVRITLDPDEWHAAACHAAGRNLTSDEWLEYLGVDEPYRATCAEWPAND